MSNTKFLDLLGLQRYDAKIKTWVGTQIPTTPHLYRHRITVNDTNQEVMYCFQVINASNTPFNLSSFFTYLENNYIVGVVADYNNNSISEYQCNGGYDEDNNSLIRYSRDYINSSTPGLTFNDSLETIF